MPRLHPTLASPTRAVSVIAGLMLAVLARPALAEGRLPIEERLGERWRWRVIPGPDHADYMTWIRPWESDHLAAAHTNGLSVYDGYEWSSKPGWQDVQADRELKSFFPLQDGALVFDIGRLTFHDRAGRAHVLLHGQPSRRLTSPAVTADGRVLAGDGQKLFDVSGAKIMPSDISSPADATLDALAYDADGGLWCTSSVGIHRYEAGRWSTVLAFDADTQRIDCVVRAGPMLYFAATDPVTGGYVWDGESLRPMAQDTEPIGIWDAVGAPSGELIVASKTGSLRVYRDGAWRNVPPNPMLEERIRSVALVGGRRVFVLTGSDRLVVCDLESDRWASFDPAVVGVSGLLNTLVRAAHGGFWVGTDRGITRFDRGSFHDVHLEANSTVLNGITAICEDAAGHLWVGSGSEFTGARRWDGSRWHIHNDPDGIGDRCVHTIRRGPDGAMWFAALDPEVRPDETGGLVVLREGRWQRYSTDHGVPIGRCYDFAFADDGTTYAATFSGIARFAGDRWEAIPRVDRDRLHAFALLAAPDGALWLGRGLEERGIFRFLDGKWSEMRGPDWNDAGAASFAVAPDGRIWFAAESGLCVTDGSRIDRVSFELGAPSRNYWPVLCDPDGTVWAGSRGGGLVRFRPDDDEPPRATDLEIVGAATDQHVSVRWDARDRWNNTPLARIRYRVRVDDAMTFMTDARTAQLDGLSRGRHVVDVTAVDLWGNSTEEPARLSIMVEPATTGVPTNVVIGLALIIAGTLGLLLYRRGMDHRRRQREELERLRLEASERHFRTLVEGAEVILARFDAGGRLTYISPQVEAMLGVSPSDIVAQGGLRRERIHPEDHWQVEAIREARRRHDPNPLEAEFRIMNRDDEWIWIVYCQRVRVGADGSIEGYDVAALETTKRKKSEAGILRERDFLLRLLEVTGSQLTDLADFCGHLVNAMADALETSMACISLIEGDTLRVISFWDRGEIRRELRFPIELTPCSRVRRDRAPCAIHGRLAEQFPNDPCIMDADVRRYAGVPIYSHVGHVIGVAAVMSEEERPVTPEEVTQLRLFGQVAGAFIERHQAEAELQESERTLQTLMSNLPGMAYRCRNEPNWTMEFVSEGCRELCGYEPLDLLENRTVAFNDLIHPDDQEGIWAEVQSAVEQRRPFQLVYRIRTAAGVERWVWEQGRGVHAADGALVALEGFVTNISELRRAESIQAAQRSVLEQIAKGAPLAEILDRLVHAVERLSSGLLCSVLLLDETEGRLRHASGPSLPASYNQAVDGAAIGPSAGSCGTAAHRKARVIVADILVDPLWADYRELASAHGLRACWSEPILSGEGNVLGTFAMYYREVREPTRADIQLIEQAAALAGIAIERNRAEETLRRERDFKRSLIEESPTFFVAIDRDGKTTFMNDTMLRALGYTHDEIVGRDYLTTFIPESDRQALAAVFATLMAGQARTVNENHVRTRDGRELLVEWHGNTVFDENGRPEHFFGVGIDITDRRRLEERMLQTQKMETVGRLAAGVAHDFNNLLTALHGHVAHARQSMPEHHPATEPLLRTEQVAEQCTELVRSLLTFTRQLPVKREPVDLNVSVRQAVRLLGPVMPAQVAISFHLDDQLPPVIADAGQVQQIVMNLCMNARDAMPHGGQLEIRTTPSELPSGDEAAGDPPKPAVELAIGDTGCGMDEATRARAFEPFFTTKEGGRGTGLGLSIVYGIVSEHGGRIHIATQPKLGTIVRVRLPAATEPAAPRDDATPDAPAAADRQRPLTVLFADDETDLLETNADFLASSGINVVRAEDGAAAMRLFEAAPQRFDVVILDHKMPGVNGLECARRMAAIAPETPVLMTTGFVTAEVASMQENGVHFSVLQKPFRPQTLLSSVRRIASSRVPS